MRRIDQLQELAGVDHLCGSPAPGEMAPVAGHQKVGGGGLGTLQKPVVRFVRRNGQAVRRLQLDAYRLEQFQQRAYPVRIQGPKFWI